MPKWLEILIYIHVGIAVIDLTLITYAFGKSLQTIVKNSKKGMVVIGTLFAVSIFPLVNILTLLILFIVITLQEMIYKERLRVDSLSKTDTAV